MNRSKKALLLCCTVAIGATIAGRASLPAQGPASPNGAALFAANCAACHGSDGRSGERAPDIATRREVLAHTDADLIRIVQNGLPGTGMPTFGYLGPAKVQSVVKYLRTLQGIGVVQKIPGDARLGETFFYGKAECSKCHMVNGRGGFLADDLGGYSLGRSADDIRAAIVDPDRKLTRSSRTVTIVTQDGQKRDGFIRTEDNFSLVLQTEDGAFLLFKKEQVARVELSGHSSMPLDYESRLSSKELDDLVSYLLKSGTSEKKVAGDDDE